MSLLYLALDIRQRDQQVGTSAAPANALVTAVMELLLVIVIIPRQFGRAVRRHRGEHRGILPTTKMMALITVSTVFHRPSTYEIVTRCLIYVSLVLLVYLYLYVAITVKWSPADEPNTDWNYIFSMHLLNFLSTIIMFELPSGGSLKGEPQDSRNQ